jgi:hypothetical protein
VHLLLCGAAILLLVACVVSVLQAQISDEDKKKRDAFLKAREEMRTVPSKSPAPKATGKPKPAAKKPKSGKSSPAPKAAASPTPRKAATPEPSPARAATPDPTPTAATPARPAVPTTTPPPPVRRATPPPLPPATALPDQITIEKSGLEETQGYEPPPPPPPRRRFLFWSFGPRRTNYRYLSNATIEAIRRAPVQRNRWRFIIVHYSATRQGNARAFDHYHRRVRKMQNGMAYHFVVGNGTSSGNGEIEIGDRWRRQINGGHVHSDYLNNISLGICFVGDFSRHPPTRAQMEATEELIRYLRERCGGRIPVRPHREMNPPRYATDCPGDAFPYSWFRKF